MHETVKETGSSGMASMVPGGINGFLDTVNLRFVQLVEWLPVPPGPNRDVYVFLILMAIVHESSFWGMNLFYAVVAMIPPLQRYKIQPQKRNSSTQTSRALLYIYANRAVLQVPETIVMFHMWVYCGGGLRKPVPGVLTLMWQFAFILLWNEIWFYWAHRLFHHPLIYKHIHKRHHEFKVPNGIASEYAHPIEDIVVNVASTFGGAVVLGCHPVLFLSWLALRIGETVDSHSGYALPYSPYYYLPSAAGAEMHDYHHSHIKGCYGAWFLDGLMGTDKDFLEYKRRMALKEKEQQCHTAAPAAADAEMRKRE